MEIPSSFDLGLKTRKAIHKAFPQAVPNTYLIDKQERPPCREACPIGQEAAGYVALIAQGRFAEAAKLIRMRNPLPVVCGRVCYHPCESECNRGFVDEPVAIQHLKRFALDWQEKEPGNRTPSEDRRAPTGAGRGDRQRSAGLACAHDLALRGYRTTVFERHDILGGMLAVGIPTYRLPRERLRQDIDFIRSLGVEFRENTEVGRDVSFDDLRALGFKAFFIATGAHSGIPLDVPGENLEGVVQGVQYLRRHALGIRQRTGRTWR